MNDWCPIRDRSLASELRHQYEESDNELLRILNNNELVLNLPEEESEENVLLFLYLTAKKRKSIDF